MWGGLRRTLEAVGLVASLVTLIAGIAFQDVLVALYAAGVAFTVLFALLLVVGVFVEWKEKGSRGLRERMWNALVALVWIAVIVGSIASGDLSAKAAKDSFTGVHLVGVIGLLFTAGLFGYIWVVNRREGNKQCPDCISTVPSEARICRYCGFRFPPGNVRPMR